MEAKKMLRISMRVTMIAVAVLALSYGLIMAFVTSPFFKYPENGDYPAPRIGALVWPSIGYPALVVAGGTVEVEMDLRDADATGRQPQEVGAFRASMTAAREGLENLTYALEPQGSSPGVSTHWPEGGPGGDGEDVWRVGFKLPEQAARELYDLRVEADLPGNTLSSSQPHALAVMEDNDNNFDFLVLSDIHVHERNNSSLFSHQTDKGISEGGEPLFFEEAIRQVNLIRPDFVLMLGDYIRGQRRPGELLYEYETFYDTLLQLDVPAFLLPGNHDKYINEIDGARFFQENIGPKYFSFDVGNCHFACLDTYEWPQQDRVVMNKLFYMEPRKWGGQVLGAANENDPSSYSGELAWVEGDLGSHDESPLKIMAMHHDPYSVGGEGFAYRNVSRGIFFIPAGGGQGRTAVSGMASRHDVDMVFGGHLHTDWLGEVPWQDGGGETLYSCQNPVYFDTGGIRDEYPGYRLVRVRDAQIISFAYLNGVSSFPFYDGSVPKGLTDLDLLDRPALQTKVESFGDGASHLDIEVDNYLGCAMDLAGLIVEVPGVPSSGYEIKGGEIYQIIPIPGKPGRVMLYARALIPKGIPGHAADLPGQPYETTIVISASQ